ncbi:hypothetical protein GQ44DRAFT_777833 [Phaeosphaeriaceae sp. PMI808]|nr:hypothetical protein GQ44DRAFT_777833 [Phaeosphaeriaceae sp. PMI808]
MTLKRKRSDRSNASASALSCQKRACCTNPSLESPLPTPPPAFSIFLLTEENLREHTKSLSPQSETMPKPSSSNYPEELKLHIENTLLRKRETQPSPNAKKIASKRQMAAAQDEDGGVDLLKPYLLFVGEDKDDENGIPGIVSRDKINLASEFLPPVPNGDVLIAQGGQLSLPQPDIAIGYTPFQFARNAGVNLKPATGSETFHHAENQAARDGSTIVNHLYDLFYEAYDRKPTAVEASHVSVTCDMQTVQVWIHWREETAEEERV